MCCTYNGGEYWSKALYVDSTAVTTNSVRCYRPNHPDGRKLFVTISWLHVVMFIGHAESTIRYLRNLGSDR